MNSVTVGNQIDEQDLDEELEQLQQEQLDEQMLKTGTVPVSDQIQRMPAVANGERKWMFFGLEICILNADGFVI